MHLRKFVRTVFLIFTAAILTSVFAVCLTASASNIVYYNYDSNSDGKYDTEFELNVDIANKTAEIVDISCYSSKLIIPTVLKAVEVYDENSWDWEAKKYDLTVTGVNIEPYEFDCGSITSISLGYTINHISAKSLGYTEIYTYVPEIDEYDYVWAPVSGLKINCTKGTAGEDYAKENGFAYTAYENLGSAVVTLSAQSFTFTGKDIKPGVTVKFGNLLLVNGTDYTVSYSNNKNAGTAKVTVTGKGAYRATATKTFKITSKPAGSAKIASVASQDYTGKAVKPALNITLSGVKLVSGKDYSVTYSSNKQPGTAKATVKFKGNYSGSKSVSFKIALGKVKKLKATASASSIKLSWGKVACDKYRVYRYDAKTKKYKLIKTVKTTSYTDKKRSQLTKYTYRVKPIMTFNKKTLTGTSVQISQTTGLAVPSKFSLAVRNKAIKISWGKNTKATGYKIYRAANGGSLKLVKIVKNKNTTSWTDTSVSNNKSYVYGIISYKKTGGKTYYSDYDYAYSGDELARLNGATLKSHRSFKVYNRQGKKTTSYTYTLSDKDIKILKKFAQTHFKSGMNRADKLMTTLNWINKKVKYALGSDWDQIVSKSWVDAIFTYKKGQCAQYNGAMAAMMAYLGYDVNVVQGYRGTWKTNYWQHFWTELKIDGITYVMEAGNYGRSGSWMYFVAKYSETSGYIRNQKNM